MTSAKPCTVADGMAVVGQYVMNEDGSVTVIEQEPVNA